MTVEETIVSEKYFVIDFTHLKGKQQGIGPVMYHNTTYQSKRHLKMHHTVVISVYVMFSNKVMLVVSTSRYINGKTS